MTNVELSWVLDEIADLLVVHGRSLDKVFSYKKLSVILKTEEGNIHNMIDRLADKNLSNNQKEIISDVLEIIEMGTCKRLNLLREKTPDGVKEMLKIPGIDAKLVGLVYKKFNITSIDELYKAAKTRQIRKLPGVSGKTELSILRGIELLQKPTKEFPLGLAMNYARSFIEVLNNLSFVQETSIAGAVRRGQEMVKKVCLVIKTENIDAVKSLLEKHPLKKEILKNESNTLIILTYINLPIEFVFCEDNFVGCVHHYTGSYEYIEELEKISEVKGINLTDAKSEKNIYEKLEMPFITPELREDKNIIYKALAGEINDLIELEDIKGDLHLHTNNSDGANTIEEMIDASIQRGYEYIAITDHSQSLTVAGGLSQEEVENQHDKIKKLNDQLENFKIFTGIEVDILKDGKLDYADEVLEKADIIIASVHNNLRQDEETITTRVENAIKNPHVDILAHPTGRVLGRRDSSLINLERIFELAEKTQTALEINSSPDRLDLGTENLKLANKYNIRIAINTDAHSIQELSNIEFGVMTAKRGLIKRDKVINTMGRKEIEKWLKKRK